MVVRGLIALVMLGAFALGAAAEPVFFIHLTRAGYEFCDSVDDRSLLCSEVRVDDAATTPLFAWVMVADVGDWIAAAQFGIRYTDEVQVAAWTLCAPGFEIPEDGWPSSGTGNAIGFVASGQEDECYLPPGPDGIAKVGFFYISAGSRGAISVTRDPRIDDIHVSVCPNGDVDHPEIIDVCEYNGSARVGTTGGHLPDDCRCSGPPVKERSWAQIKSTYRDY